MNLLRKDGEKIRMKFPTISAWVLFLITTSNIAHASERGTYNDSPRLPEPMVFDLALPLGVKKYDYEFNALTLFQYNFEDDAVEWSPELEYAYADGYSLEVELPMKNTSVEAFKMSLQGTFDFLRGSQFIHGWQYIGEYYRPRKELENTLLYVFGYQISKHWSTLNMTGVRLTDTSSQGHLERIFNGSLFYSPSKNLTMGLEVNWESRPYRPDRTLVMPQLHIPLTKHGSLQFGIGMLRADHQNFPDVASRIIFRF